MTKIYPLIPLFEKTRKFTGQVFPAAAPVSPLRDDYQRRINYLRVSLTDRCNLQCCYCRPGQSFRHLSHEQILTYEEILRLLSVAIGLGIDKVRLTGGEPLVRKDAVALIEKVAALPGLRDLSLTTNGVYLARYIEAIQKAGIRRLNLSLDSLNPEKVKTITGRDVFAAVWQGLRRALELGFAPLKVNMVVMRGLNDDELIDFAQLSRQWPLQVRFIELMPRSSPGQKSPGAVLSGEIKQRLETVFELQPLPGAPGETAERYRIADAPGEIGFISPLSRHFCQTCNRLRLTADGGLRPCLFSDQSIDIKTALRAGASSSELAGIFQQAVREKPRRNIGFARTGPRLPREMSAIGG